MLRGSSVAWDRVPARLKIRVSVVRFRPWSPSNPESFDYDSVARPVWRAFAVSAQLVPSFEYPNLLKPRGICRMALSNGRTDVRALLTALGLLIVTACASSPPRSHERFSPAPPPPPGYATLYIYRGYMENGAAIWPIVYLNDVKVADVKTYSYTYVYVWPGKYHLRAEKSFLLTQFSDSEREFDFDITSERTYYLQFGNGGGPNLTLPAGHTFRNLV